MKLTIFCLFSLLSTALLSAQPEAMFSPYEGVDAFNRIYKNVEGAKKTAHLTIYSWSDNGITDAMENLLKDNPEVKLRVVLHRPLARKDSTLEKVAKLEKLGAMFKMARMNMHEKFVLVDNIKLVNTSANMSGGAKTKYAEDFVFIDSEGEKDNLALIESFQREFAILWNSSDDIVSIGEKQKADILKLDLSRSNLARAQNPMTFHSSSMNFTLSANGKSSTNYKKGRSIKLSKRNLSNGERPFVVSTAMIRAIDNAKESIDLSLNHFNLYSVSQALIRAVKRGVEIRLAVDNQEFKTRIRDEGRKSIEMTPRFVRDWKKLPGNKNKLAPVRVKYYSHAPHYATWLLNHHKYMIVDIDTKKPTLFAGSFNISKNAELKQFDNLVEFKGEHYRKLMQSYKDNHTRIWMMNRTSSDKPKKRVMNRIKKIYKNSYVKIHSEAKDTISLTWSEAVQLQEDMKKIAPGIFKGIFKNKACTSYDFKKKVFFGGGSCK